MNNFDIWGIPKHFPLSTRLNKQQTYTYTIYIYIFVYTFIHAWKQLSPILRQSKTKPTELWSSSSLIYIFGTKLPVANISGNSTPGSKYVGNWKMRDGVPGNNKWFASQIFSLQGQWGLGTSPQGGSGCWIRFCIFVQNSFIPYFSIIIIINIIIIIIIIHIISIINIINIIIIIIINIINNNIIIIIIINIINNNIIIINIIIIINNINNIINNIINIINIINNNINIIINNIIIIITVILSSYYHLYGLCRFCICCLICCWRSIQYKATLIRSSKADFWTFFCLMCASKAWRSSMLPAMPASSSSLRFSHWPSSVHCTCCCEG